MIWLSVFLVLTITQAGYIWVIWDKISNIVEVSKFASDFIGSQLKDNKAHKKTMGIKERVAMLMLNYKGFIWLPITLILMVNMIVATFINIIIKITLMFL